jgi:hypothetical protein
VKRRRSMPLAFFASLFAPSNNLIASTCPLSAAQCSAVAPVGSFASLSAPCSTSTLITSTCYLFAAQSSAVTPFSSR